MLSNMKWFLFFILISTKLFAEVNFRDTFLTPTKLPPNLSEKFQDANYPVVATDNTGKYVYVAWQRFNGKNFIIQMARSADYGTTFLNALSTPADVDLPSVDFISSNPNLSLAQQDAIGAALAADGSGRYVYIAWARSDGKNTIVQMARSEDYGKTFINPERTPTGISPNLSREFQNASYPAITTDDTGQYVYIIWTRFDGKNTIIQMARSEDYGKTFTNPEKTPTGAIPNLSESLQNADGAGIETDKMGRYVYVVWHRSDGVSSIIQTAISSDYGKTFESPDTTPTVTSPNLSSTHQEAIFAELAVDNTGRYIYIVWQKFDGKHTMIQMARSEDYGKNFESPESTPTKIDTNLSESFQNAIFPEIATNSDGKYVYVVWTRSDGKNTIIQTAISSDYGKSFSIPESTPTGASPNLSVSGQDAIFSEITTDDTGKYVYIVWTRSDGSNTIIQMAMSLDYGRNFTNPSTTPTDLFSSNPNLSKPLQNANYSEIATDKTGKYIYVVWTRSDGTNFIIQIAVGIGEKKEKIMIGKQRKIRSKLLGPIYIKPKRF